MCHTPLLSTSSRPSYGCLVQRHGETKKSRPRSYSLGLDLAIIRGLIERKTAFETGSDLRNHYLAVGLVQIRQRLNADGEERDRRGPGLRRLRRCHPRTGARVSPRARFYSSRQGPLPQTFKLSLQVPEERLANDPRILRSSCRMASVVCRIRLTKYAYSGLSNCSKTLSSHSLISLTQLSIQRPVKVAPPWLRP